MDKNKILVFILLIFSLVVTAALVLTIAIKGNNQEFKERTLILIDETNDDTTSKVEYTICQWTKTKIEIKECPFENGVKKECSLYYPGFGDYQFKDEEFINLLDALEIQPGDTTTINMEDLGDEIWKKYKYLFGEGEGGDGEGEGEGEGEGGAAGGQTVGGKTVVVTVSTTKTATVTIGR